MDLKVLWNKFLETVKQEVSSISYNTWFAETELHDMNNGKARVIVPMPIHKKHLSDSYKEMATRIFNEITGSNFEFEFLLKDEIDDDNSSNVQKEPPIEEVGVPYNNPIASNLKPNYTFDTFIVGNSNKFAHAAALSVAENPGKMYNPLFIYGSSGLGKTHLMHAIGNYIVQNSNKKVLYVTCEQFRDDFIGISRRMEENGNNFDYVDYFKNKYRNIDVLMIDDIQFLGGATSTQQEFFHTFNTLYSDNKQIVITSDRSPDDLKLLEDRLRTRFCWGLTVDIYPPDFELRINILKKKIAGGAINQEIPDNVIEYIASNMGSDVRQLEGSINRLLAYSTIMGGSKIDLDLAIEALKDYTNTGISEKNNIRKIQKAVAEYFQISVDDMKSKKRSANLAFPRQVAMYLCRQLTDESFPKIGTEFGGKDHSTVMHSCDKIEAEMKVNKELVKTIENIKKTIT
ncbi:MAG TPA: chromosomal replication initiator protein DnaA [Candidatus Faecenecus gallistercoris]|uniref:Chromosomal replication initiator protein DnaA n=1 Tax=Candidatus Faecenecus gallistercoris TaxID=2840793 RepID=A0A9D0YYK2_9FIRM|nr:chromosomal replication initiator protein DnaA [Bacillota bacterium]MDY4051641.1 chromosomal replication initiator protein DnaA [Candidatus Faecenecus gallistercoris]CDE08898.1 chromosomal replication initiator protein DnaA [Bacillus sp. CAG:988]MDD7102440.1 chromosomal replication initiator protein DnaA [Bacillota bacterium]PWL72631.1 MAG: chromosomal replication initiator protein DnaA [Bacillota bacterium]